METYSRIGQEQSYMETYSRIGRGQSYMETYSRIGLGQSYMETYSQSYWTSTSYVRLHYSKVRFFLMSNYEKYQYFSDGSSMW